MQKPELTQLRIYVNKADGSETNGIFLFLRGTHQTGQPKAGNRNKPVRHQLATIDSEQTKPRYHQARSWGRLQMIGIRTRTTNVNDTDRRGSPSTGGGQLQGPSLQHQSTLKARLGRSFQAGRLFRIPSCQPGTTTSGVTQRQRIKHPNQKAAR